MQKNIILLRECIWNTRKFIPWNKKFNNSMTILHIGIASKFTENMTYQDNLLSEQHIIDGHNVIFISDCYQFSGGKLHETEEEDSILKNGLRLIRLKHTKIFNTYISEKIRHVRNLINKISELAPDVIFFHGLAGYALWTTAKYKKNNPRVKFLVDSHEDYNNSGRNWISLNLLHKIFYKWIIQKSYKYIDKILYITYETKVFIQEVYSLPEEKLIDFPLGGITLPENEILQKRERIRNALNLDEHHLLLVHSGKLDSLKKTDLLLSAFSKVTSQRLSLVILGTASESLQTLIEIATKKDSRIKYTGWTKSEELLEFLCAADMYLQPGSQSATLQNAVCCGCTVAVYPHPSYIHLLGDAAFYISSQEDITNILTQILSDNSILTKKRILLQQIAKTKLDYKELSKIIYL